MNEDTFIKIFGSELNLRILHTLNRVGPSTIYRINTAMGVSVHSSQTVRRVRGFLQTCAREGLVVEAQATRFHTFHKTKAWGRSHQVTEYSLNQVHEIVPALCRLFTEAH